MRLYRNVVSGVFLLSFFSAPVFAADTVLLDEIVVKGQEITSTEEILTIREVRESTARDIAEAVSHIPGITSRRKGSIANDIVLRGLQRDNINVLMDGVRVQGGCPSRMDPPSFHFDFAEVESIEVVKGPYDVRFAGSMGGLVNAISKRPEQGTEINATATYGSYELFHASLTGSIATETYDALAGYAYKYSLPPKSGDGKRITDIYPETSRNRYRPEAIDSKAYDIDTVWAKTGYQVTEKTRTELSAAYQDADHVLYPALFMDAEHDRTGRVNWTTSVDHPFAGMDEMNLQVYWTEVDHLMHDEFRESSRPNMMVTRDYMMETDADTTMFGVNLDGTMPLGSGELLAGLDGFYRNWDAVNRSAMFQAYAPQPMIPDVDHNQLGAFAEYKHPLSNVVTIKGGVRLDYADSEANRLTQERLDALYQPYNPGTTLDSDNDFFEPTANLQLLWQASEGVEVFAGVASASRMPDPQELYIGLQRMSPNWVGNPDLDPVRNNQADLGVKFSDDTFFLNGSIFFSRIDDFINLVQLSDPDGPGMGTVPPARSYRNVDAEIWGGELSGQISLPWDLYLSGTLAYTEGENRDTNTPLAEMPPLSGSVAVRYDVDTWFVEVKEVFADRQDRVDDSLNEEETSGWGITNVKAGVNLDNWSVFAGVDNLFDKYYFNHLSFQRDPFRTGARVPETGTFAYATVMYRFE